MSSKVSLISISIYKSRKKTITIIASSRLIQNIGSIPLFKPSCKDKVSTRMKKWREIELRSCTLLKNSSKLYSELGESIIFSTHLGICLSYRLGRSLMDIFLIRLYLTLPQWLALGCSLSHLKCTERISGKFMP